MIGSRRNKKASIMDVFGIMIMLVVITIFVIAIYIAQHSFNKGLNDQKINLNSAVFNESVKIVNTTTTRYPVFLDWGIVFVLFTALIIALVSAYMLGSNPAFVIFYIILSFVMLIISAVMTFAATTFTNSLYIQFYASNFPMTAWCIDNLFLLTIAFIGTIGVTLYLKPGGSNNLF
jgi:hypothetical protein